MSIVCFQFVNYYLIKDDEYCRMLSANSINSLSEAISKEDNEEFCVLLAHDELLFSYNRMDLL